MKAVIAVPAYLNSRAYFHPPLPRGYELLPLYPRDVADALAAGRVQAALVPVGALPALGERVRTLGSYGIAAAGAVGSVLLFSHLPFAQLGPNHVLRLTAESATSVRLLALLLGHRLGFARLPRATMECAPVDGELLIGDAALRVRQRHAWTHVTDLAQSWRERTGLPFVFARWVVRCDAPVRLGQTLSGWLAEFAAARPQLDELVARRECSDYELSRDAAVTYLGGMQTTLDDAALAGQAQFLDAIARHRPAFTLEAPARRLAHA